MGEGGGGCRFWKRIGSARHVVRFVVDADIDVSDDVDTRRERPRRERPQTRHDLSAKMVLHGMFDNPVPAYGLVEVVKETTQTWLS